MLPLVFAVAFDRLALPWPNLVHPVAWLGRWADALHRRLFNPTHDPAKQICRGIALIVATTTVVLATVGLIRAVLGGVPALVFDTFLLAASFTLSGLVRSAESMREALARGDLEKGRHLLRNLCSRDASELTPDELTAATIESVAENTSDSWVAPLFWWVLLGMPGIVFYRVINTLDAMYGYRGRFEYFGKPAARLDDLLNLIPSRVTAFLFFFLYPESRLTRKEVLAVWFRDRNLTESPNAGQVMAMMAALLGVRLEKRDHYTLGDSRQPLEISLIEQACLIARRAGVAAVFIVLLVQVIR